MSLSKDNQLQNQSVIPNHVLVVNTLLVFKVTSHSKVSDMEVLRGLCLEDKLRGVYGEWLGKVEQAAAVSLLLQILALIRIK